MRLIPARPLLLLTDRTLLTPNWTLSQAVAPCITGGVNMVVLREAELPDNPRLTIARFVKDGVGGRVPFLLSGTPEFALKAGADGLLIEDQSVAPVEARRVVGPDLVLGIVTPSIDSLRAAQSGGADFALVALDWSNPDTALNTLQEFCRAFVIPIIAGVDMDSSFVPRCIQAGAEGVSICSVGMASYDRTGAVRKYSELLKE